ncbi:Uu.00g122290.m01.CDS01 [Anthostomella pinea]|uniref:Uu.00g122290.m01.CDS01 n=1 Tax=Anthostomella pinea TaxID=933095 RepID=A0AAI8VH64_9PEZI|nr:Uu.00g122290.m01.CDS01 [Anthostomella pinea]
MAEMQVIPAKHGVATFVPAGQTIKIVNTSGTQVIDTWAFALPKPDGKKGDSTEQNPEPEQKTEDKAEDMAEEKEEPKQEEKAAPKPTPKKNKGSDLPSQEDAEEATQEGLEGCGEATQEGLEGCEEAGKDAKNATPQKSTWSSYVPSLGFSGEEKGDTPQKETQQQKDSRTWSSYFPSGQSFSSYVPKSASDTVSMFAKKHERDPSKSYIEQLQDFSKTPVGAGGLAAITGSGYGGTLYAGYQAYNAKNAPDAPPMEFLSMAHSRTATLHMRPKINDTLVSNLREPMLTVVEDTSPGIHDTLIPACDPMRYKNLGMDNWEKHGSCAENLVLALKELNERAGLKGARGVGADVTINAVPAPLNLFMNIPWDDEGDLAFKAPKGKDGDYIRLKAERDVVVVMSACPNDVQEINANKSTDAHFIVEGDGEVSFVSESKAPSPPTRNGHLAGPTDSPTIYGIFTIGSLIATFKHGVRHAIILGWGSLVAFCILHIVAGRLEIAVSDSVAARVLVIVGLAPLTLVFLGLLHECRAYLFPARRRWLELSWLAACTIATFTALVLTAVGASHVYKSDSASDPDAMSMNVSLLKAGLLLLVLVSIFIVGLAAWSFLALLRTSSKARPGAYWEGKLLLSVVLFPSPLLGIVLLTNLSYVFTEAKVDPLDRSLGARLGLQVIEELVLALTFIVAGILTRNVAKSPRNA